MKIRKLAKKCILANNLRACGNNLAKLVHVVCCEAGVKNMGTHFAGVGWHLIIFFLWGGGKKRAKFGAISDNLRR